MVIDGDGSRLFLVIGNSGSGKDSVMKEASKLCPGLHIIKRYVTRPAHNSEDFMSVTEEEFGKLASDNLFIVIWESYGLKYGITWELDDLLGKGKAVLLNVSRTVIDRFRIFYPGARVIFISANLETLKKRLESRGREDMGGDDARARLLRAEQNMEYGASDCIIDNSGNLLKAAGELCSFVTECVYEENT